MNIDFLGALNFAYIPFLIALFVPDFFSTFGTVLGVGAKAGYLDKDGNLPGIDKCFKVDDYFHKSWSTVRYAEHDYLSGILCGCGSRW